MIDDVFEIEDDSLDNYYNNIDGDDSNDDDFDIDGFESELAKEGNKFVDKLEVTEDDNDDLSYELDPTYLKLKQEARDLFDKLKAEKGVPEPIIITENGLIKKCSELTKQEQKQEFIRCAIDPIYLIETYFFIFDQTKGTSGEIVNFKLFDFQKRLIKNYVEHRFNVSNKYRQAGISTATCAFIAWYIMFNRNRTVAIVANKQETATNELMADVVEFIEGCPDFLRPKPNKRDSQKLKIYDNGSKIGAFNPKGLRGYTPTLLFWDEVAWTEKSDKFWEGAKPTLQTGGRAIFVSTPNSQDPIFFKTFDGAKNRKGINDFNAVELWWFNDPRYNKDLKWFKNKGFDNEIILIDEQFSDEKRIQLMEDKWEASSPWFETQVRAANGDKKKIAQEILCVGGSSTITIKNKITQEIQTITISEFYNNLKEQNIS